MESNPTISVIFPVFNAAKYVRPAIESILTQSYQDFELIIIDDGSTDDSLEIITGLVNRDRRCRIYSRENMGVVFSCNQGLELARGEYIFRMDSDDIARPQRFERQLAYLRLNQDCVAVGSKALLIDPDGLALMEQITVFGHDEIDSENLNGSASAIVHPTLAMRRSAALEVGGYRKEFEWAEDLDLFLRLAEIGRLANIPEILLEYRQHLSSVGYAKGVKQTQAARAAVADARRRRGLPPANEEIGASAKQRVIADEHRKWAWWALRGGNSETARKHAFRALRLDPLSRDNVRLLACAVLGR